MHTDTYIYLTHTRGALLRADKQPDDKQKKYEYKKLKARLACRVPASLGGT